MKLTLLDRIMIDLVLPKESNFTTLILVKDIKEKIVITQDEIIKFEIKDLPNGNITWKQNDELFDIDFTEAESNIIKEGLKKLDQDNKLTNDLLNIYKIFVN